MADNYFSKLYEYAKILGTLIGKEPSKFFEGDSGLIATWIDIGEDMFLDGNPIIGMKRIKDLNPDKYL